MLAAVSPPVHAIEIIAHRGASHDAPENTLASIHLGWAQNADGVEVDIHLSQDGHIVVLHDAATKRTAGIDKPASEQTLAALKRLGVGSWKDARFASEKVPPLDEAIATLPVAPTRRLVIEMKCGSEVLPALKNSLAKAGKPASQFLIIGFNAETMRVAKAALPQYEMYWLSDFKQDTVTQDWTPTIDALIRDARAMGIEGLNLRSKAPLDALAIAKIKTVGLRCYAWTVDSPADAKRLVAAGIDGLTTNRPLWLC